MKLRRLAAALLAAAVCAALPGCGGGSGTADTGPSVPENAADNTLYVGIAQDLDDSLDPHKTVAAGTREIMFNVFEGLVKPTPDGNLTPAVAESWSLSDDHLTYTFVLRPDVKFHNGDTVTAEDVVYSLRRCAEAADPGIVPVKAFASIAEIAAPDEATVVLTLSEPSNEFLSYLTTAILPADYAEQDTAPVGTGPFRFVSRKAQETVILERFEDYWGEPAKLDRVVCRIIENGDSILMSLQSGAVDLFAHLTIIQATQLGDDFDVAQGTMNLVQALYLNNAEPPFDDVRVRRALCYGVDKQGVIDQAFDGFGVPIGSSMYPAFGKYFDETLTNYYPHNPDQAKALLEEAGYPNGFSMTITVPSNYQPHVNTAQVLAEQLREIGVEAELQLVEWNTWRDDVYANRHFQSTVIGVDASNMTARALLERFQSEAGNNFINYRDSLYDALFARALASFDDGEQTELYRDMERNLTENAANVYLQDMADLVAVRKGLEGIRFYPIYALDLSSLYWAV